MSIDKIIISIMCLLSTGIKADAQNLVPNPGFELMNSCSETFGLSTIDNIPSWFDLYESNVSWYSDCFCIIPGSFYCPPNLYLGTSFPLSGTAMLGLGPYSEITHQGEAVGVKLTQPLLKDSAYCYSFWLKNGKNHGIEYIMREFNVAFVNDTTGINQASDITSYETIINLVDNDWHNLSGYYIAQGGEEYLLFGVFDPTPNYYLETPQTQGKYMYYFLDDFSLELCNKDSLLSVVLELPNVLTLNNDLINEVYSLRLNNIIKLEVQVLNRWGNVVREYDGITEVWDGKDRHDEPLTEGIYFVKAVGETTFGDVIQKTQFVTLVRP